MHVYFISHVGIPKEYGLDNKPCYNRSYALVCEHRYSGGSVWLVGEDQVPITQSSSLYTVSSPTLEIHNTSKAVSEGSEVYHCSVDLPTGTTVRGSGYILSPLSECVLSISSLCTHFFYKGIWKSSQFLYIISRYFFNSTTVTVLLYLTFVHTSC